MTKKSVLNKREIEQKTEQEIEQQTKILVPNPRKLLIGFTNPYLASEFGYHMAKFTSLEVLIIDADGLNPVISTCLGIKELVNDKIQVEITSNSSFNMAMEYISRTQRPVLDIFKKIAVKHHQQRNLSVLTGNDDIEKFEDYSITTFELLLKQSIEAFDLVIVNIPYNIYDAFYLTALDNVEYMLYGFNAYADSIMTYNNLIQFLDSCGRANIFKHQYVPINYSSDQLSVHDIKLVVDNQYICHISANIKRQYYRNSFNKTYAKHMSKKNINEYHKLAKAFGYQTKKSFFKRKDR